MSTPTTPAPVTPGPRVPYVDIDRLSNAYGLVAVISQRTNTGMLTFSIFKEFERDGVTERTTFIPEDMIEVYMDFAKLVHERMRVLRQSGTLAPPAARPRARPRT